MIEIDDGDGLITRYAHASKLNVRAGDLVVRGQRIATVGTHGTLDRSASAFRSAAKRHAEEPGAIPASGGLTAAWRG
jgi:murein DD-endopeptidase MepM/ murein hydrolase activator NlpD